MKGREKGWKEGEEIRIEGEKRGGWKNAIAKLFVQLTQHIGR